MVDVCYRLPDMGEMDKAFFRKLEENFGSQALVLIADFNQPGIC